MKKEEIVEHIARNTTLSRSQAWLAVAGVINAITDSLVKGESVFLRGFGTFKVSTTKERKARDINSNKPMTVPSRRVAKLILSKSLKSAMNDGK